MNPSVFDPLAHIYAEFDRLAGCRLPIPTTPPLYQEPEWRKMLARAEDALCQVKYACAVADQIGYQQWSKVADSDPPRTPADAVAITVKMDAAFDAIQAALRDATNILNTYGSRLVDAKLAIDETSFEAGHWRKP